MPDAPAIEPLLVDASAAARLCGISRTCWYTLISQGRVPPSIRLGRRRLWLVENLRAWLRAGAPPRERWGAIQDEIGADRRGGVAKPPAGEGNHP